MPTRGTAGNDTITPGLISTGVTGGVGSGIDTVIGSPGSDYIDGINGNYFYGDVIDYASLPETVAVVFDTANGHAVVRKSITGTDTLLCAWDTFILTDGDDSFATIQSGPITIGAGAGPIIQSWGLYRYQNAHRHVVVTGGPGQDTIDGGARHDLELHFDGSPAGVRVDLGTGLAEDGFGSTDRVAGIIAVKGTGFADTVIGGAAPAYFWASPGDDLFDGGSGFESLVYGDYGGLDLIARLATPGPGILITLTGAQAGSIAKPGGGTDHFAGIDEIDGTWGDDTLVGIAGAGDVLAYRAGYGNDWIEGHGSGLVLVDYAAFTRSFRIDLQAGTATSKDGEKLDTLVGVHAIRGGDLSDTIYGGTGDDSIDGVRDSAADILAGGLGDDVYRVGGQEDLVVENPDSGHDTVISTASLSLYANVEALTLAGTAAFGIGNSLANAITGNAAANLLLGGNGADTIDGGDGPDQLLGEAGADSLIGGGGRDTLWGGAADDTLDGGTGADALYGGAGDDTYIVDSPADLTFEAVGGGLDTVLADIALTGIYLWPEVENLVLLGTTPFGVGNALDNHLTGNAGANWLFGGGGDDTLDGAGGDDVLFGQAGADSFVFAPGSGHDFLVDYDPAQDRLVLDGFAWAGLTWEDGATVLRFRTAAGAPGDDVVVLRGTGTVAQGRLGPIDITGGELHIETTGTLDLSAFTFLGGNLFITAGAITGSGGLFTLGGGVTPHGPITLSGGTITLGGGHITTAAAPPEDHLLIA